MPPTVEICHRPDKTLHRLVRTSLYPFLEQVESSGRFLPSFVQNEFNRFLGCGNPKQGFSWLRCTDCDHDRIIPYSCKTRGFCPSCGGRRMASRASRWVDEVFPNVAVRQIVLTIPWKRRWLLARKPKLVKGILRLGLNEVFRWYKRKAIQRGLLHPKCGSVTVVQRFGSALNLNVHFHCLMMDGVYALDPKTRRIGFHRFGKMTKRCYINNFLVKTIHYVLLF